jgi:two-component system LytT family response regulator
MSVPNGQWHFDCFMGFAEGNILMIDNRVMAIRSNGRILLVNSDQISWVEAARNSVRIHLGEESYLLKSSLDRMEQQLNGGEFVRIHRCTIVNLNHIRELRHWLRGTYQVFLQDGTKLLLSRGYRDKLFSILGKPLG